MLSPNGLRLSVKQEKKRVLGVFGGGNASKVVPISSEQQARVSQQHARLPGDHTHDRSSSSTLHGSTQQHGTANTASRQNTTAPKKGLFRVVGSIGSSFTKIGKDITEGVSKTITARPATTNQARAAPNTTSGDMNYSRSSRYSREPESTPVAISSANTVCDPDSRAMEIAVYYVQVPFEDSMMQVFLTILITR